MDARYYSLYPRPAHLLGMDRSTGERIRLPTTQWPFDHCAVATELSGGGTQDAQAEMVDAKASRAWKMAVFAVWVASFFVVLLPLAVDLLLPYCRDRDFVNAELSKAGGIPGAYVEEVEVQEVSFQCININV